LISLFDGLAEQRLQAALQALDDKDAAYAAQLSALRKEKDAALAEKDAAFLAQAIAFHQEKAALQAELDASRASGEQGDARVPMTGGSHDIEDSPIAGDSHDIECVSQSNFFCLRASSGRPEN
jgi:hypothetical protein